MLLSEATKLRAVTSSNGETTYHLEQVHKDWSIITAPCGGYTLTLLVKACILHQSTTAHRDINGITASYLKAAIVGKPAEVRIAPLKPGRSLTYLRVGLYQNNELLLDATAIFSDVAKPEGLTLDPSSLLAPRNPVERYPFPSDPLPIAPKFNFRHLVEWTEVPDFQRRPQHHSGLEWGSWIRFKDEKRADWEHLCFVADLPKHGPDAITFEEETKFWFPTLSIQIQFFISPEQLPADPTFAIYSLCKFVENGRHDAVAEVWTKSGEGGQGRLVLKSWQMAMTGPKGKNVAKL
ncbi:hypothetical protein T439DRAFT_327694 [Meredithblackwellia eburnea MCA 4105]